MYWSYLAVPVIWALMFAYSHYYGKNIQRRLAAGEGPQMFHEAYAGRFSSLQPGEIITHAWAGLAYEGPVGATNSAMDAVQFLRPKHGPLAAGKPKYLIAVLTTHGRLVVALDTSPEPRTQSYVEMASFQPGVYATDVAPDHPAHGSGSPRNPFDPRRQLQLTSVTGVDGDTTLFWLSGYIPGMFPALSHILPKPEGLPSQGRMS